MWENKYVFKPPVAFCYRSPRNLICSYFNLIWSNNAKYLLFFYRHIWGLPRGALVVNCLPASAGEIRDTSSIPGLGRSPRGGQGNSLQYSCLGNSMDRGAWWTMIHRVTKSQTRLKWLCTHTHRHIYYHNSNPVFSGLIKLILPWEHLCEIKHFI